MFPSTKARPAFLLVPFLIPLVQPAPSGPEASAGVHAVELPSGSLPLYLPRDEQLDFEVRVDFGVLEATVADCAMTSRIEAYRPPLLLGGSSGDVQAAGAESVTLQLNATGEHTLYTMDARMETRLLPQEWPAAVFRTVQDGTEKRRRELLLGQREGRALASYRSDTTEGAPRGTRIWGAARVFDVLPGSLDMLRAIYMIRTLVRDGHEDLRFVLVDKANAWRVRLHRGRSETIETPAGRFRALEVLMDTEVDGHQDSEPEEFRGPFGLAGTVHLWVEAGTGIPVRIDGELPAGMFTLGVEVRLRSFAGTPAAFQPL